MKARLNPNEILELAEHGSITSKSSDSFFYKNSRGNLELWQISVANYKSEYTGLEIFSFGSLKGKL